MSSNLKDSSVIPLPPTQIQAARPKRKTTQPLLCLAFMVFLAYVGYNYLGKPVNDEEVMITKEGYLETEISNGDVHDGSKNDYRSPLPSNCGVSVPGIQEMAKIYNLFKDPNPLNGEEGIAKTVMCYDYKAYDCVSMRSSPSQSSLFAIPDAVCSTPSSIPECFEYLGMTPLEYSKERDAIVFDLFSTAKTYELVMDWDNARCALPKMKKAWDTILDAFDCNSQEYGEGTYPPEWSSSSASLTASLLESLSYSSSSSEEVNFIPTFGKSERVHLNRALMSFFSVWGTHLMTEATFGATCAQTFVIPNSLDLGAYRSFYDHVRGKEDDYVQWTGDFESKEPRIGSWEAPDLSAVPYEIQDIKCLGSVPFPNDDMCPYIAEGQLNPVVLSAKFTPIWELESLVRRLLNGNETCARGVTHQMKAISGAIEKTKGLCRERICSGNGECVWDSRVFTPNWLQNSWSGLHFNSFWGSQTSCKCDDGYDGDGCALSTLSTEILNNALPLTSSLSQIESMWKRSNKPALPGIFEMLQGYNLTGGTGFDVVKTTGRALFDFGWANTFTDDNEYEVPKEIVTIPDIQHTCLHRPEAGDVYYGGSVRALEDEGAFNEKCYGAIDWLTPNDLSLSGFYGCATNPFNAHKAAEDGRGYSFVVRSRASDYEAELDWTSVFWRNWKPQFIADLKEISENPYNFEDGRDFFEKWGTHVMKKALFGSECSELITIDTSNYTLDFGARVVKTLHRDYSNSLEAHWTDSRGVSFIDKEYEAADGTKMAYRIQNMHCRGTSAEMSGKQCTQKCESLNEGGAHEINPNWKDFSPVVIAAEFLPIWEIDSLSDLLSSDAVDAPTALGKLEKAATEELSEARSCFAKQCGEGGACAWKDGVPICYCREGRGGDECNEKVLSKQDISDARFLKSLFPSPTPKPSQKPSQNCVFVPVKYQNLPGANYFGKIFNMYSGEEIYDKHGRQIYRFCYDPLLRTTGVLSSTSNFGVDAIFEVPIEFDGTPNVQPSCDVSSTADTMRWATSTAALQSSSTGSRQGVGPFQVEVKFPVKKAEISLAGQVGIGSGSSSAAATSQAQARSQFTYSFDLSSQASLYSAYMDWDTLNTKFNWETSFLEALKALNSAVLSSDEASKNKEFINFIYEWGTDVIIFAKMGQLCYETAFVSIDTEAEARSDFQSRTKSNHNNYLFYSTSSQSATSTSRSGTDSKGVKYEFSNIRCVGEVPVSSSCGGMTGAHYNPVPIVYETRPIALFDWDPSVFSLDARIGLYNATYELAKAVDDCGTSACGGNGACRLGEGRWTRNWIDAWDGEDWSKWIDYVSYRAGGDEYCFCEDDYFGRFCESRDCTPGFGECECIDNSTVGDANYICLSGFCYPQTLECTEPAKDIHTKCGGWTYDAPSLTTCDHSEGWVVQSVYTGNSHHDNCKWFPDPRAWCCDDHYASLGGGCERYDRQRVDCVKYALFAEDSDLLLTDAVWYCQESFNSPFFEFSTFPGYKGAIWRILFIKTPICA